MQWTGKMIVDNCIIEGEPVKVGPNGIDVAPVEIFKIPLDGKVIIDGKTRTVTPSKQLVEPSGDYYILSNGIYEVKINLKVKIPKNAVGKCLPRSTLNRLGMIKSETAVWDSGYEGYGTQTVMVAVKELKIHKNEAWFQFIIEDSYESDKLYDGFYQKDRHVTRN